MNFLDLKSLLLVLTIYVTLFLSGQVTLTVIDDENNDISWRNCSLNFTFQKEYRLFNKTIKDNRLIKFSINITWTDPQNASRNNTDITKSTWFLATEEAGKDLLLLDDQFEVMSLGTLAISVGDVALTLKQIPDNCLAELSEQQALETISGFLLKAALPEPVNDQTDEYKGDSVYVCNGTITGSGICCSSNYLGIITCLKLEQNEWTEIFLIFVWFLSVFIIIQSSRLIPKSLYHVRYVEKRNIQNPLRLKIERTGPPTRRRLVKITGNDNYQNFRSYGTLGAKLVANRVYLFLDDERFESHASNTSAINNVFHDCVQMFDDIFCKCNKDNSDFEGLKECCYYDLIHLCYNYLLKIIIVLLFSSPFVIRLIFLNNFKESDATLKAYLQVNCGIITFCLSLAILTFMVFSLRLFRKLKSIVKPKLRQIMAKAMTENINTGLHNAGETVKHFLRTSNSILYKVRFSRLSLVKAWLTIIIICLPFSLLKLCFQIGKAAVPPLNLFFLTYRYLVSGHLNNTLTNRDSISKRFASLIIFYPFLFFWYLFIFLCADAAVFFAKCCLYIVIGCLLNYDNLLVYFSFFVLISTYIFQCIQEVNNKIRNFNKGIIEVLSKISVESHDILNGSIVIKRDGIFFSTSQLSYLFKQHEHDKVNYLHVSRSFLNYLSSIPSPLTPGSRNWLYCKAFMEIVLMFLLLILVVVIVVSYGNATDLSSGMKTLITLGSGALLFLFNNILIRSLSHSTEEDNEVLENFVKSHVRDDIKEIWEIHDFGLIFRADSTENNADVYCKYTSEHEIEFFTKESLITTYNGDEETKSISVCDIFCQTICPNNTNFSNETNNGHQMTNESDAVTERTQLLPGDQRMSVNLIR